MARPVPRQRSRVVRALDVVASARAVIESGDLLRRQRHLVLALTRREVTDPHEGQFLGAVWAFIQPIMLMSVYALVFAFVFRLRISARAGQLPLDYTAYLLAGLVPWLGFQACLTRSASSVVGEANLVKQVQFPVEVLPVRTAAACLITQLIGIVYLVIYAAVKLGSIPATYALIPVLLGIQLVAMTGAAFLISAASVFFRDLRELIIVTTLIGVYLLPIFYLPDVVPSAFHTVLKLNPFSYMVWCYQDAFYYGRIAHWYAWVIFGAGSVVMYSFGYRVFRHLKPYFGDVL